MLAEGAGAAGPPLADGGVLKPTAENVPHFRPKAAQDSGPENRVDSLGSEGAREGAVSYSCFSDV